MSLHETVPGWRALNTPSPFPCLQCLKDGKAVIIEGGYLDPAIYLEEFGGQAALVSAEVRRATNVLELGGGFGGAGTACGLRGLRRDCALAQPSLSKRPRLQGDGAVAGGACSESSRAEQARPPPALPAAHPGSAAGGAARVREGPPGPEALPLVFVPVVLWMAPEDHALLAGSATAAGAAGAVQDYLAGFAARGVAAVRHRPGQTQAAVDAIHGLVLQAIQAFDGA